MNPKEHHAKKPSPTTGLFATLCPRLSFAGTGAPKATRRLSLLATTLTALALTAAPALGKTVHVLSGTFTGSGVSALSEPVGVAVDDETGNVYVVDKGHDRVEEFNSTGGAVLGEFDGSSAPTGAFSSPEAIAVDNDLLSGSHDDIYVADTGHNVIDKFSAIGLYEGQLTGTCEKAGELPPACVGSTFIAFKALHGVAVDPEGDVWVYENEAAGEGEVTEFSDTGTFLKAFRTERGAKPGIALDSSGHVFVAFESGDVGEYEASTGTELGKNERENAAEITVDGSDLFIDTGSSIEEYGLTEPFSSRVEAFPSEGLSGSEGIAAGATGTVYAAERAAGSVEVFDEGPLPTVSTEAVSNRAVHSATLNGAVNPEGVEVASCEFEYGTAESYGSLAACSPAPGSGKAAVPVSANLTGLVPDTTYHYRLVATNADHLTEATPDETFTARGPGITEQVMHVDVTAATLQADIDPNESETTYHFEYDTTPYTSGAAHGTSVPVPNASIGSGTSPVPVSTQLKGLTPGTTYYYRVVAESEPLSTPETFDGPNKAFTTTAPPSTAAEACPNAQLRAEQPYGLGLPDCRAYEMVSPLEKGDNGISYDDSRASLSGEAVTYMSPGAFSEPASAVVENRYISRRGGDGWSAQSIMPPYRVVTSNSGTSPFQELFFTPDLSKGLVRSLFTPLVPGEPEGYLNLYLADTETNSYQTISNVTPPESEFKPYEERLGLGDPNAEGGSSDLSRVVFQQQASLTKGASPKHEHVYEWGGHALYQVDVPPEGMTFNGEDDVGASALQNQPAFYGNTWHAVSADDSRVFFTGGEEGKAEGFEGQLYVRENPEQPPVDESMCAVLGDACTIEISKSQRTPEDPQGPRPAFYRDASTNGSMVFFTSRAELTNNARTGPADNAANLYEYDLETGVLSDLTVDNTDVDGAAVLGLVTASEDGSYVYFVANGVLSTAANSEGQQAHPGNCREQEEEAEVVGERTCSLYEEHYNGTAWQPPKFVATLAGGNTAIFNPAVHDNGDEADWIGYEGAGFGGSLSLDFGPGVHTARVSANGTDLAFESEQSLTGYDNEPVEPTCKRAEDGAPLSGGCSEVYLYDAESGGLVCVSCDPSGARPVGSSELGGEEVERESIAGELIPSSHSYAPRNLSEGGTRLFFQSADALVPQDSNGRMDVYEWEQPASPTEIEKGENSCMSSSPDFHVSDEGCVFPISDVAGSHESHFMDSSTSGDDVFIATADQLVPADTDTRVDMYDVRVGGGFPVSVAPPVCVNADSCKPPASPQPALFGAPASATFSGPGNPVPLVSSPVTVKPKAKPKPAKCKQAKVPGRRKCAKRKPRKHKAKKSDHVDRRASS